jgi:hypothetical protein
MISAKLCRSLTHLHSLLFCHAAAVGAAALRADDKLQQVHHTAEQRPVSRRREAVFYDAGCFGCIGHCQVADLQASAPSIAPMVLARTYLQH